MTAIHKKNDLLLYLKMEGDQGSTNFIDSSSYARIITTGNTAYIDQTEKAVGTSSGRFISTSWEIAGGAPYLIVPSLDYLGDITVEYYLKFYGINSQHYRMSLSQNSPGQAFQISYGMRSPSEGSYYPGSYVIFAIGSQAWYMSYSNYNLIQYDLNNMAQGDYADFPIPDEGFEHHAFVVEGDTVRWFLDGRKMAEQDGCITVPTLTETMTIGNHSSADYLIYGWLDEFQITAGAKYDRDFDVPSTFDPNDLTTSIEGRLSLSLEYAITSHDIYWLSNYLYRYRITVDRTKFFMDRESYYLPLLICADVGMDRVDLSRIFGTVGGYTYRKCIAITLDDKITQVPVVVRTWDHDGQIASIYACVPRVKGIDWHENTVLYFYYGSNNHVDNPNVTDA
uniref:Putative lectin/glucanase superfamily protein n=1 Tax=viral metagenome TaxID=1070528 RepID=A0A6M3KI84_9ZZZZ